VLSLAFVFGISLGIINAMARTAARVVAFIPPIVAFIVLRPSSFAKQVAVQLSTSQWIGLLSAVICAYFYAKFWEMARRSPKLAMGLESLGDIKPTSEDGGLRRRRDEDEEDDDRDEAEEDEAPAPKKSAKERAASEAAADEDDSSASA
jgi:hypothetical protein